MSMLVHAWSTTSRTHRHPGAVGCTSHDQDSQGFAVVRAYFACYSWGAPDRIRTCAHGSGGGKSEAPVPARMVIRSDSWSTPGPRSSNRVNILKIKGRP
jgi:hypothetical protein